MRVVDTSVWIEIAIESSVGISLVDEVPPQSSCIVPTIVQLELAKWLTREVSSETAYSPLAYLNDCEVVVLDSEIALLAAEFCATAKLSTADSIIYATAIHFGADLLTCDAHFKDLPGVIYRRKTSSDG